MKAVLSQDRTSLTSFDSDSPSTRLVFTILLNYRLFAFPAKLQFMRGLRASG